MHRSDCDGRLAANCEEFFYAFPGGSPHAGELSGRNPRSQISRAFVPPCIHRRGEIPHKWTASLGPVACEQAGTLDAHFKQECARHVPNCRFEYATFCKWLKILQLRRCADTSAACNGN